MAELFVKLVISRELFLRDERSLNFISSSNPSVNVLLGYSSINPSARNRAARVR